MILLIKIYITQKIHKKGKQCTKMKYKMNNFNNINTLERKRNEQISNNKK